MSATATGLELFIGANVDGLVSGVDKGTTAVESAGKRMAEALRESTTSATRSYQEMVRAAERSARSIEAIEDRYAALSITKGNEHLAAKYLAMNREYARELALVGSREDLKVQIMERYARRSSELQQEIVAAERAAASEGTSAGEAQRNTTEAVARSKRSLGDALRGYAREQRAEGAAARFYVQEVASFLPVGDRMKSLLGGVAAGMIGGGGLVLAFELGKVAMQAYREATERANEEMKRLAREGITEAKEAADRAAAAIGDVWSGSGRNRANVAAANLLELRKQLGDVDAQMEKLRAAGKEDDDEYKQLVEQRRGLERQRVGAELALPGARLVDDQARRNDRLKAERGIENEILKLKQQTMTAEERIRSEGEQRKAQARVTHAAAGLAKIAELEKAIDADTRRQLAEARRKAREDSDAWARNRGGASEERMARIEREGSQFVGLAEGAKLQRESRAWMPDEAGSLGWTNVTGYDLPEGKKFDALKKEGKETGTTLAQDLVQPMVEAWSSGIAAMIAGQESLASVVRKTGAAMLKTVIDGAMKKILAAKAVGQAEAAAANAWNPILAAAAAATISALISGFMTKLPSARGGWMVPTDTIASVHAGERILPARYSKGLDAIVGAAADGGGVAAPIPGLGGLTLNLNLGGVLDAQSFRDGLRDRGWIGEIVRELARAQLEGKF